MSVKAKDVEMGHRTDTKGGIDTPLTTLSIVSQSAEVWLTGTTAEQAMLEQDSLSGARRLRVDHESTKHDDPSITSILRT